MATWSPTLEGFRTVFRRPALPFAEVLWRWCFGAAACVLLGFGFIEYLDTLPVSSVDLLFLRTRHPLLISQPISRIFRGSGLRFVLAAVLLSTALAVLWIVLASLGRAATLVPLLKYIRKRARQWQPADTGVADPGCETCPPLRLRSLAGLHFLRAGLALAACASGMAALILASFNSTNEHPRPVLVFFLTHLVLFVLATSVAAFPLSFAGALPIGFVLAVVFGLTLAYFAIVDTLYVARLAGYVAILEAPPPPVAVLPSAPEAMLPRTGPSTSNIQTGMAMVDQDETILSDTGQADNHTPR